MTKDNSITLKVKNMYKKYPYPSPSTDISQTNELLNLLPKEIWQDAPKKVKIFNPAFEEVSAKYATGIISELGIFTHKKFIKQTKKVYPMLF